MQQPDRNVRSTEKGGEEVEAADESSVDGCQTSLKVGQCETTVQQYYLYCDWVSHVY